MAPLGVSSLNNDGLLRAILQARNTPDPDCNYITSRGGFWQAHSRCFNPSSADASSTTTHRSVPHGARHGPKRRGAMRTKMPRSTGALDMHTRPLAPLSLGDKVFQQNQRGSYPRKWDKSCTVVELGNYNQYWVKVDGSGRLSLRNRRFLRKFVPPSVNIGDPLSHSRQSYGVATMVVLPPTRSKSAQVTTSLPQLEQQQKYGLSRPTK